MFEGLTESSQRFHEKFNQQWQTGDLRTGVDPAVLLRRLICSFLIIFWSKNFSVETCILD